MRAWKWTHTKKSKFAVFVCLRAACSEIFQWIIYVYCVRHVNWIIAFNYCLFCVRALSFCIGRVFPLATRDPTMHNSSPYLCAFQFPFCVDAIFALRINHHNNSYLFFQQKKPIKCAFDPYCFHIPAFCRWQFALFFSPSLGFTFFSFYLRVARGILNSDGHKWHARSQSQT